MIENQGSIEDLQYPQGLQLATILISLLLGTSLLALDATIISVATPKISTQFRSLQDVGWYGAGYSMLFTAMTPVSANFYKYFEPKRVYLGSIAIFEIGSVICATAPTSRAFITGRAIAGVGAAGLLQGAFGILTYVCSLEMRPLFLGGVVSIFGLFASLGPVIGGVLTQKSTWRWCFWINLPIGGAVFGLITIFLKLHGVDQTTRNLPLAAKAKKLDIPGIVLMMASVTCLFLALQEGGITKPWGSAQPIGLFVGFGILLIIFGVWQWYTGEDATIPVRYLRDRTVIWGSIYLFWDNMASYITIYYMPFYFQAALNQSPLQSGVSYMSLAVPQMIGLFAGGGITTATGQYMPVILVAQIICVVGCGLLTTLTIHTRTALWATYMVITGLGIGLGVNVPHIAIQAVMESDNDIFIANGIASFFGQLGGSLAIPISNSLLLKGLQHHIPKHAPGISPISVIKAGALDLPNLSTSRTAIEGLREAWALSVSWVNILLTAVICISLPTALGMKWLNIKKISKEREEKRVPALGVGSGKGNMPDLNAI
ncbi:MFS general substrate transporter [Amniculicola lignicola CBS 123094]|uniref:MFS general substrate transporter n=1 Tax=Amniculicola lignicola CBS 123094 TaxID=1392246 RepID=A0A6A5WKE6_9PLEO|nr:MFS general substrate transporter [Amniculicola lignicola CBS 123094]